MTSSFSIQSYGRQEVKNSLHKNMMRALAVSTAIHCAMIGGYYLNQLFSDEDDIPFVTVRLMKYSELGPPPSITNTEKLPTVGVMTTITKPSIGIPVPVPDIEVNPEQTFASQQELSQAQSQTDIDFGKGNVAIQQDIQFDDDPNPEAFIPVEKNPMPVKQVKPEYPEIARRASVEGTVWIKILVDKQGKAKKAIVIKSDAEIFNEPARAAALQWVFTPAMMNNGPVSVWVAIPFRFQLNKQGS